MADPTADTRPTWRQPIWILGHFVALVGIVTFVYLGWWQYSRHADRVALDATLTQRMSTAAVPLGEITGDIDDIEYRRVSVAGEFDTSEEVVWRARTRSGVSGHHVITPLILADGTAVLVDRGWVPIDLNEPPVTQAAPPPGTTTVVGIIRRPQPAGGLGPSDPADGELDRISRLIPDRLAPQVTAPLVTRLYVQRSEVGQSDGELPLIGTLPVAGGGPPHLSYAVQWWVFAAVVAVSYPILLYRTEMKHRRTAM